MEKEKVLIVHNYYIVPGGEDTVVQNEMELLQKNGHEVILYSRHNAELKKMSVMRKLMLPLTTIFNPRTFSDVKRLIRQENIKIVHVHNTLNLISPAVYYAALSEHIRVIQTIHNFRLLCPGATLFRNHCICEECLEKSILRSIRYKCYRGSALQTSICVLSMMINRMTGVYKKLNYICLTEFNKTKLQCLKGVEEDRIWIKPNFAVNPDAEVIPFSSRENMFIFAGRLDELKGIDVLIDAWELLGDDAPQLIICGVGPLEEACKRKVAEKNLKAVSMLGFLENVQVRQMIARAKALILPTMWYEGFPMSIVEAFSVGTPVITTDIGNAGSLVAHNLNGRKFRLGDAADLARMVREFPDMVDRTREIFENRYSEDKNYSRLLEIYREAK